VKLREWIDANVPPWLLGLIDWPGYRLRGRCWAEGCGRLMALHSPWRLYACERTPMAVAFTEQGEALADALERERASHLPALVSR
jgi:hypothetical protein